MIFFLAGLIIPILLAASFILIVLLIIIIGFTANVLINLFILIQIGCIRIYYNISSLRTAERNSLIYKKDIIEEILDERKRYIEMQYNLEKTKILQTCISTNEDFINAYRDKLCELCKSVKEEMVEEKKVKRGKFLFRGKEEIYDIKQIHILNGIPAGRKFLVSADTPPIIDTDELFKLANKSSDIIDPALINDTAKYILKY
jgi:hypothetical protein